MNGQSIGVLGHVACFVDVTNIQLGIDALAEEIEREVHHVNVASAFAIAKERALDAVRAREHSQFGRRDASAAVVMRMQRDEYAVATCDVATEPLDGVRVEVRRVHLDRGWQIQDQRILGRRANNVTHRLTDLERVLELGTGEAFGRVFIEERRRG